MMLYDTMGLYDPREDAPPEEKATLRKRLKRDRGLIREMLPRLRELIEDPDRDANDVFQTLRPYHLEAREVPMTPDDLPELEALCRLILEQGGSRQSDIQRVLLRLVGATAAPASVPFLLEMLHYSKRGDQFGPERRQLALWGLARIAVFHDVPEAYDALKEGMDDHRAKVRLTAADLNLDAYLDMRGDRQEVPPDVVEKLENMAQTEPDEYVRRKIKKFLREPWAQEREGHDV
jgi:hypothetical protein